MLAKIKLGFTKSTNYGKSMTIDSWSTVRFALGSFFIWVRAKNIGV